MENQKKEAKRKVVLSLVQPSGDLTIGNYLGAIQNFVRMQDDYECFFGPADLHAITLTQNPADLRRRTREIIAYYIACGIDPRKVTMFVQSQVPEHTQLYWALNSISYIGQLSRMTQYKEKAAKHADNLNAALFTYPVLMAADILIYQANYVPVGVDQKQHLELARDLAERFNNRYSPTFVLPEPYTVKETARIMSLKDPSIKMSKSDEDPNAFILIKDEPEVIRRKIARAVTDSKANISYSDEQPGLQNLLNIYSAYTEEDPRAIAERWKGKTYAEFKTALAEVIVACMDPIRRRFYEVLEKPEELSRILDEGRQVASRVARKTVSKVYRKIGFLQ